MTEETENLLWKVGLGLGGYFLVVKPLLATIGINPEQKALIDSVNTAMPDENPFSFQFTPLIDYFNQNNVTGETMQEYIIGLKAAYDATSDHPAITWGNNQMDVATAAEAIYKSFGFMRWYQDTDTINSIFNTFNSQQEVAAVSAYLWYNYNVELWNFLKNGTWNDLRGLSGADLAVIIARVNSLPITN